MVASLARNLVDLTVDLTVASKVAMKDYEMVAKMVE